MNWVIIPVRAGLTMTRHCIESVRNLDIPVRILVIGNGISDAWPYLFAQTDIMSVFYGAPKSVAACWNIGLNTVFSTRTPTVSTVSDDYALVINNDTELRRETYSALLADGSEFVTCVGESRREVVFNTGVSAAAEITSARRPHPDFSCFLIRRSVWDLVGRFDENFRGAYGEDADYDVRMHKAGIQAWCLSLPFWHMGSGTLKTLSEAECKQVQDQAAKNREYFKRKWGVEIGSDEYYEMLGKRDS